VKNLSKHRTLLRRKRCAKLCSSECTGDELPTNSASTLGGTEDGGKKVINRQNIMSRTRRKQSEIRSESGSRTRQKQSRFLLSGQRWCLSNSSSSRIVESFSFFWCCCLDTTRPNTFLKKQSGVYEKRQGAAEQRRALVRLNWRR